MAAPMTPELVAERWACSANKVRSMPVQDKWAKGLPRWKAGGHVYFVRCGDYVKIGWSTNVRERISKLRTATPYPLEFLFCIKAPLQSEEVVMHDLFRAHHHRDEWFRLEGALKEFVEAG